VEAMAAYGIPEADIAEVIDIDPKTLRKHYRKELNTGSIKANTKIAESLYRKALGDGSQSVTAAIFWLKTRAHWKETVVNEVSVTSNDSIKAMMERIAAQGTRVFDKPGKPVLTIEGTTNPPETEADHVHLRVVG
jgi:hypothetical protein